MTCIFKNKNKDTTISTKILTNQIVCLETFTEPISRVSEGKYIACTWSTNTFCHFCTELKIQLN